MHSRTIFTILLSGCISLLSAQAPPILWQKCLGGSWDDRAWAITPTLDGGSILAGRTESNDGDVSGNHSILYDIWVVKQDVLGNVQWQRCIGGTGTEEGFHISPTSDGGYIVAGLSGSDDGDATAMQGFVDGWMVKLDGAGDLVWQRSVGGTGTEIFFALAEGLWGSSIAAGWTDSNDGDIAGNHGGKDAWLAVLSPLGAFSSQQCYGGSGDDAFRHIVPTLDGNHLAVGSSASDDGDVSGNHGGEDVWVVKLNSVGTILWQRSFGGTSTDEGMWVLPTADGGYMVAATTSSSDGDVSDNSGSSDFWLLKLDASGNLLWEETYGGTGAESVWSVAPYGNGYALAGSTLSNDGDVSGLHVPPGFEDAWIIGVDATGSLLWQRCLGSAGGGEFALASAPTALGHLLVAGLASSNDGDVSGHHGGGDAWVVKLDGALMDVAMLDMPPFTIDPVPAHDALRIRVTGSDAIGHITLCDALGRTVRTIAMTGAMQTIAVGDLRRGAYLVTLRNGSGNFVQRVILE